MEPPPDGVESGSGAGPSLGAITNDEHIISEQGSAQRVGSNLSTHNTRAESRQVEWRLPPGLALAPKRSCTLAASKIDLMGP